MEKNNNNKRAYLVKNKKYMAKGSATSTEVKAYCPTHERPAPEEIQKSAELSLPSQS